MKNSSETFRNRTRDLPTCSAVPQPTAVLRAPEKYIRINNYQLISTLQFIYPDLRFPCSIKLIFQLFNAFITYSMIIINIVLPNL